MRSPAFTLATVLTLALAIAANASIFALVHRIVLNPLPYPDPGTADRISTMEPSAQRADRASRPVHVGDSTSTISIGHAHSTGLASSPTRRVDADGGKRPRADPDLLRDALACVGPADVPALGRWFTDAEGSARRINTRFRWHRTGFGASALDADAGYPWLAQGTLEGW